MMYYIVPRSEVHLSIGDFPTVGTNKSLVRQNGHSSEGLLSHVSRRQACNYVMM